MRKKLLRIPFKSIAGFTLDDPAVAADRTLQYRIHLRAFWLAVKAARVPRLTLLQEYARIRIAVPKSSLATRRAQFRAEGRRFRGCFSCGSRGVETVRHHILQLQHGGPNTTHNVVNVCGGCHAAIHPWL